MKPVIFIHETYIFSFAACISDCSKCDTDSTKCDVCSAGFYRKTDGTCAGKLQCF